MTMHTRCAAAALATMAMLTGCAGAGGARGAPVPASGFSIVDARSGATLAPDALVDSARAAGLVVFGEFHDDAGAHRAQRALLEALARRDVPVVLSLEMFERDVQPALDAWLAGTLADSAFLATARPWGNYATDYRPLVELAKARRWPVVAANVPRPLASAVSRQGLGVLDTIARGVRATAARELVCPTDDAYHARFVQVMSGGAPGGHGGASAPTAMVERFYLAQCLKDETMAESVVAAMERAPAGTVVVHLTGAFHSDSSLGTVSRIVRRRPQATPRVLTTVRIATAAQARTLPDSVRSLAHWLVLVPGR